MLEIKIAMSEENIHRLEGGITTGGLVIRKKKNKSSPEDDEPTPTEATKVAIAKFLDCMCLALRA